MQRRIRYVSAAMAGALFWGIGMAETKAGKKIVPVKGYVREVDGHKQHVDQHRRSTPHTSTGKAKSK